WASRESEVFPRRLYTATIRGPSHSLVNSGVLLLRSLVEIWRRPPRVVLVGYAHRIAPWIARVRRLGLLRGACLVVTNWKGLDARLLVVTFSPETLGYDGELPPNCEVRFRMPLERFLALLAGAKLVVAALKPGSEPHGQTTVVQALRLGKAIVATRDASLED